MFDIFGVSIFDYCKGSRNSHPGLLANPSKSVGGGVLSKMADDQLIACRITQTAAALLQDSAEGHELPGGPQLPTLHLKTSKNDA